MHTIGDNWGRWRALSGHGVYRRGIESAAHLRSAHNGQHGNRGGRQKWIFEPDETTENYLRKGLKDLISYLKATRMHFNTDVREWDVGRIEPQVAFPHSPGNTRPVRKHATFQ